MEVRSSPYPDDSRASHAEHDTLAGPGPSDGGRATAEGTAWCACALERALTPGDVRTLGTDGASVEAESRNPPSTQSSLEARYINGASWDDGRLPPVVDKLPLPAEGPSTSATVQAAQPLHHSTTPAVLPTPPIQARIPETTLQQALRHNNLALPPNVNLAPTPPAPGPEPAPAPQPPPKPSSWAALLATPGPPVQAPLRRPSAAAPPPPVPAAPASNTATFFIRAAQRLCPTQQHASCATQHVRAPVCSSHRFSCCPTGTRGCCQRLHWHTVGRCRSSSTSQGYSNSPCTSRSRAQCGEERSDSSSIQGA